MALKHFIQKIILPGGEADLAHLQEAALIEKADLSGPSLILRFNDTDAIVRDVLDLKQFDVVTVAFSDYLYWNSANFIERFVVLNYLESQGGLLTINCLQATVFNATLPARKAKYWVGTPDVGVIQELLPGALDGEAGPVIEDYHLNPGERPTNLLRRICRERGKLLFYRRGTVVYQSIESLMKRVKFDYHYRDTRKSAQIIGYRFLDSREKVRDRLDRHYVGWGNECGKKYASAKVFCGKEMTSFDSQYTLDKLHIMHENILDMVWDGNGGVMPGVAANTTFRKPSAQPHLKLPNRVVFGNVTHWYRINKYQCRVQGLVPQQESNRGG